MRLLDGSELESVQVLRQVWQQYYELSKGRANWRAGPQAEEQEGVLRSPYDTEARTGKKREMTWLGYKVHLTETCDVSPGVPHLLVQVQTTVANVQDVEVTETIQQELAQTDLLPEEQIVNTGYVDADLLVSRKPALWDQAGGSSLVRQQLASQSGQGLRCRPLPDRLASHLCHVPARTAECSLDAPA